MANVLYLVHRLPYPPNKGDKVRSYHLLRYLAQRHRVFLGAFVDEAEDQVHVEKLRVFCSDLFAPRLHKWLSTILGLRGMISREALTLTYYRRREMHSWVSGVLQRESIDAVIAFSSSMTQYAFGHGKPVLVDFVDVDSAKWAAYAGRSGWPRSWIYRREAKKLLEVETAAARMASASFFVTPREVDLFHRRAGFDAALVEAVGNGVDTRFFCPDIARASPFKVGELPLVFTGAMDYLPNIDAMVWFTRSVLPALQLAWPAVRLHIVGRRPTDTVKALAGPAVNVTGAVADVRPYLQHAAVVVATMRLARGIHNKVLEAMAMACPVVASADCVASLEVEARAELLSGNSADDFVREIGRLLGDRERARAIGLSARNVVCRSYQWSSRLAPIGASLDALVAGEQAA